MRECHAGIGVDPDAFRVRPAMMEAMAHRLGDELQLARPHGGGRPRIPAIPHMMSPFRQMAVAELKNRGGDLSAFPCRESAPNVHRPAAGIPSALSDPPGGRSAAIRHVESRTRAIWGATTDTENDDWTMRRPSAPSSERSRALLSSPTSASIQDASPSAPRPQAPSQEPRHSCPPGKRRRVARTPCTGAS